MRLCNNCNESRPGSVTRCRSCGGVEFRIESLIPKGASKMKVKKRKISVFDKKLRTRKTEWIDEPEAVSAA